MKEAEFAYRIRQALNEGAQRLDYTTVYRLEQARHKALTAHRPQPTAAPAKAWVPALQPAGMDAPIESQSGGWWPWLHRAGLVAPALALVIGFVGIHQWQHTREIQRLADMDLAVLLDDGPIDALADSAFGQMLKMRTPAN
jgi:hypothetical protein